MPLRSLRDELLASVDPVRGRRLLDEIEFGVVRPGPEQVPAHQRTDGAAR